MPTAFNGGVNADPTGRSGMENLEPPDRIEPIEYWSELSAQRERSGDYLGSFDAAFLGLEQHPEARELQYRAVLNLSRTGASKRARQLWHRYALQANFQTTTNANLEENIAALGARLDREEALVAAITQRKAKLNKAAKHYETIYDQTASTFLGINAAVLYELSDESAHAQRIAARIVADSGRSKPQSPDDCYQLVADRAAAALLLDNLADAHKTIEQAAALAANAASIASTRRQLIQICDHKHIDREIIAPLRNRNVIHYTGHMIAPHGVRARFPAHAEAQVTKAIQMQLERHNVGHGYGSLACGADTLIVEALLERKGDVGVVLPFETSSFVKESVANGGAGWLGRFENCLRQVTVVHATDGEFVGDTEVFAYASALAMGLALLRAQQLGSEAIQLAVWDGQDSVGPAGSSADIGAWQNRGLQTVTIDSGSDLSTNVTQGAAECQPQSPLRQRKLRAIMFGDFHGFSRLTDRQLLIFYGNVMNRVATILDRYEGDIAARNTWGDGLFVVFTQLSAAARCALEIQSHLAGLDWGSLDLPTTLGLRLGLDAASVFEVQDPVMKSLSFAGSHISRTARLEPSTPPGEVYVTEPFAALFALLQDQHITCEYVGMMQAAKNFGRLRTYLLRKYT
jgi:adenylate cyclase